MYHQICQERNQDLVRVDLIMGELRMPGNIEDVSGVSEIVDAVILIPFP
jgi:hypothetical protein